MRNYIFIFFLIFLNPAILIAQQDLNYNKKGDDAMRRNDYRDAKMWYEEGVANCDSYSIDRLTDIWLKSPSMRPSMRSLMNKCLNCLNVKGTENDTIAIKQLILYYKEGIGTPLNEELSSYWTEKLDELRKPKVSYEEYVRRLESQQTNNRMKFFIGYTYSMEMPYGINVGGVRNGFGWYLRFKTNMSFQNGDAECTNNNGGELVDYGSSDVYRFTNRTRTSAYAATFGAMIKCTSWLYASVGLGYGNRSLYYEYIESDLNSGNDKNAGWAKNIDSSVSGIAGDCDLIFKINSFYISAGCSTVNFKYIDLNAGVGVFF